MQLNTLETFESQESLITTPFFGNIQSFPRNFKNTSQGFDPSSLGQQLARKRCKGHMSDTWGVGNFIFECEFGTVMGSHGARRTTLPVGRESKNIMQWIFCSFLAFWVLCFWNDVHTPSLIAPWMEGDRQRGDIEIGIGNTTDLESWMGKGNA